MSIVTTSPRGTNDVTPENSPKWLYIESVLRRAAANAGFSEIRTPTFEHTELFARGVGDTTDVVQKEMYTFVDKGDRSITLRPEGTAGAVRSFIQNGLFNAPAPVRLYYLLSCFRYEKPQAGRLREFHQFGVECFGSDKPAADAEVIAFASSLFDLFGCSDEIKLHINSIGCKTCRAAYGDALRAYFAERRDELCPTCLDRLDRNPMRILDCKSPVCSAIAANAPHVTDFLCDDCRAHFDALQARLTALDIPFTVDPTIVRGLDYYSRTVFEFVTDKIGAQATVLGGGRYDPLVASLGGPDTPALGFAMGLERLLLLLDTLDLLGDAKPSPVRLYLASMGDAAAARAQQIVLGLRLKGIRCECDVCGRSVKAQMKYADKIGAAYTAVLGDDELANGTVSLRCMSDGSTVLLPLDALADGQF